MKSTRADVERLLGRPVIAYAHSDKHVLADARVYVSYVNTFPCDLKPPQGCALPPPVCSLPKDTVTGIIVRPELSVPLAGLNLDLEKFTKVPYAGYVGSNVPVPGQKPVIVPKTFLYTDRENGFSVGAASGQVFLFGYGPNREDQELYRCRDGETAAPPSHH